MLRVLCCMCYECGVCVVRGERCLLSVVCYVLLSGLRKSVNAQCRFSTHGCDCTNAAQQSFSTHLAGAQQERESLSMQRARRVSHRRTTRSNVAPALARARLVGGEEGESSEDYAQQRTLLAPALARARLVCFLL